MYNSIMVKRGAEVRPLTGTELNATLAYTIQLRITALEQRFSRARNRMVKLRYRNEIQELNHKLSTIYEGY